MTNDAGMQFFPYLWLLVASCARVCSNTPAQPVSCIGTCLPFKFLIGMISSALLPEDQTVKLEQWLRGISRQAYKPLESLLMQVECTPLKHHPSPSLCLQAKI